MTEIFLDIENTILDEIFTAKFLPKNCEKIKNYIMLTNGLVKVNLFTWGWTKKNEIEPELVNAIFDRLGVDAELRGDVFVKEDSVNLAIERGWLNREDKATALIPGMMRDFGISKVSCFMGMVLKKNGTCVLIDDLVDEDCIEEINNLKIVLINPWSM